MKPVRAIFFDLDNTLVDDDAAFRRSLIRVCVDLAAGHAGLDAGRLATTYEELGNAYWTSRRLNQTESLQSLRLSLWQQTLAACGRPEPDIVVAACDAYSRYRDGDVSAYPDAAPLLDALAGKLRLAVITNGWRDVQQDKLRLSGLERYFELVVASGDVGVAKPEAAIFRHALEKLGVAPAEAWHIGDSLEADVAGAKGVGVGAAWLNRRGLVRGDEDAEPDIEVRSLAELAARLG